MRSLVYICLAVLCVVGVAADFTFLNSEVSFCNCKSGYSEGLRVIRKIGAMIEDYDSVNMAIESKLDHILGIRGDDENVNGPVLLRTGHTHVFDVVDTCDEAYRTQGGSWINTTYLNSIYQIYIMSLTPLPISAFCNMHFMGGGWLVVQRRMDGSVNFFRDWWDYERGFGNISGEFWFGLDKMHVLTTQQRHELIVVLHDKWATVYERYDDFVVGSRDDNWPLVSVGTYTGMAGDALSDSVGQQFSTADWDHDAMPMVNCALEHRGAWWFKGCQEYLLSHLNGEYVSNSPGRVASLHGRGIAWRTYRKHLSYTHVEMMIRPWRNDAVHN